jgi:hypothetical protein
LLFFELSPVVVAIKIAQFKHTLPHTPTCDLAISPPWFYVY